MSNIDELFTQEELEKCQKEKDDKIGKQRRDDSFRRANDIRYKDPKTLKQWQLPLFYEIKIREEIQALEEEIEREEQNKK